MTRPPLVLDHPAADPRDAEAHFASQLAYQTDCADVHADLRAGVAGIVVIDCRSAAAYAAGHIPGAVSLPHRLITRERVDALLPDGAVAVTYCNGPHCNASTRGALRLAELGCRVKEMSGGMAGWLLEGFAVEAAVS